MSTRRGILTLAATLAALGCASISAHAWFPVPTDDVRRIVAVNHEEPLELSVRVKVDPGTPAGAKVVDPVPVEKTNAVYPEDTKNRGFRERSSRGSRLEPTVS